ncbi:DUF3021 domain-containing protein [Alkalihalobacillus trypoxylicola]|uniref:DUF3021 domain-containing protein n=1 Tax=Alkalihalobacillus trypoxylicola TaxID=519424 RepID=A0A162DE10_9BACI|nr:DUF3021 domain-containing protein [Alkalihalobacillus trypoxylicola]KYG29327.1 hypothetical protein AZF04_07320 [Alkalihalobacillus trypoxylicola]
MFGEILHRSLIGLGFSSLITFISLTSFTVQDTDLAIFQLWLFMLGNMLLGIYFGVSTFIFNIENWSPLKQFFVHFALSLVVWFFISIFIMGWIQLTAFSLLFSFSIFIGIYLLIAFIFTFYYKKIETELNDSVK